ncbi:MAG: phosphatase [Candidatus Kapaibacterium sp.]|nr:MAG: phosphatase [Candidatus Kapabacteria bacterium]
MTIAALDIGTNTLLMLVARIGGTSFTVLADEHDIARLGEGVGQTGRISAAAIERARGIIARYSAIANKHGAQIRAAVGTSVFRSATNAREVAAELGALWGAPIEILSGEQEAELCFFGTVPDGRHAAVLDIGGGSTELIAGHGRMITYRRSIEVGALRLAERYWRSLPAQADAVKEAWCVTYDALGILRACGALEQLYAVAGTPTTLALLATGAPHFDSVLVDGHVLRRDTLEQLWDQISTATLDRLRALPGVHPHRADILPAGTLILRAAMDVLGLAELTVSVRGVRYGVVQRIRMQLAM